ncbi:MAG: hypothetical protein H7066_19740 [Cytophagaceae bacterium]|nr:hypothetical protein [Gemmatimonadaceae bacterium]
MTVHAEPPWLESEDTIDAFLAGFHDGTFPIKQWTHGAHVVMATAVLWAHPMPAALDITRAAIRRYNEAQGGMNTATSGYHETLTRLWLGAVGAYLATLPPDCTRVDGARLAWHEFSERRSFFREWYSYDLVTSVLARATWQPPDRPRHLVESLRPDPR